MEDFFERELAEKGKLIYTNVGVSMLPWLREGRDLMVIERAVSFGAFDAVLFRRPGVSGRGKYVLHRILKEYPDGKFFVAGDNCTGGEAVAREDILGVLTGVIRNGRLIKTDSLVYRLYVRLWCAPYRTRFFLLKSLAILRRFGARLKRFFIKR